ncbi:hypothetical protein EUX98_g4997 [Antrodiella citrinella]|uniref:SEC7 domain-containing protein n=1 Tax=Antrodiella citrinella TaxID=2447956 RepID=A0A4S4MTK4_9APHY|nr:hypothetical protein EUX98_g4997 [Antrodiella citrinella]
MEPPSVAEQRATAVAKLKRAASLPRMKDGRRPPMHVEAVSEGERHLGEDKLDEDSAHESEGKRGTEDAQFSLDSVAVADTQREEDGDVPCNEEDKLEEFAPSPERPTTPGRKRRSRSRTRSRGSKDLRKQQKPTIITNTTESSADETYASTVGDDIPPPSPPLVSPIPSHFAGFPASRLLRSPIAPASPLFYPGTQPPTPILPSLDDIQRGLFRSNSAGAARAMAMQKLTGEPLDFSFNSPSSTPPPFGVGAKLTRNNTVAGGERIAARQILLRRLNERIEKADGEQVSGGEEPASPVTPVAAKRRRRRSRRSSSRASIVLDDRDDRELPSTSPNTPLVPSSSLPRGGHSSPDPPWPPEILSVKKPTTPAPTFEFELPMGGRGVLVEPEDEDMDRISPQKLFPGLPVTPGRVHGPRLPHTSDAPSSTSTDSAPASAIPVPFFISSRNGAYRADRFPASPFATPLKEKTEFNDEDEESETYAELRSRSAAGSRAAFERDSEISWVADPVPRMPVNDDDDDDDSEQELPESETQDIAALVIEPVDTGSSSRSAGNTSLGSPHSKDLIVEPDISPEVSPPLEPPSPFGTVALQIPATNGQTMSTQPSPSVYPMRLSVALPNQLDRAPSAADWHDDGPVESTPKRGGDGTWERMKNVFSRSNSSTGRRSRTNSIGGGRDRRYHTDSSVSRESGASQLSPKDKSESFSQQQSQGPTPLMQSPSASASILSLAPPAVMSGSPIPPASSADMYKYADPKLRPFPGIKQLEEQRNRAKGISSPDVVLTPFFNGNGNGNGGIESVPSNGSGSSSSATTRSPEVARDRKLSHQMSDSRLVMKYHGPNTPPAMTSAPSSASQVDYFSLSSSTSAPSSNGVSSSLKLPMNREGVKTWLKVKKLLTSQSSTPATPPPMAPPPPEIRAPALKKPSLSDLLLSRKDIDLSADWEEINNDKAARTPVSAINTTATSHLAKYFVKDDVPAPAAPDVRANGNGFSPHYQPSRPETPQSPRNGQHLLSNGSLPSHASPDHSDFPSSPPEPPSSTTPDPQSSLDEFPAYSDDVSSSGHSPDPPNGISSQSAVIMNRLEEVFGRGSKSSFWPAAVDDPPRKLILSSPVLQVANANTVKDRFLFLFSDIIIIAKPVVPDYDTILTEKFAPLERKFIVKSTVLLKDLKFCPDREDSRSKTSASASSLRHPVIRGFVHQFVKDPDSAISTLFEKSSSRDDPIALGQLMFRTIDLDRARLGEYLSRRTSKVVLKAYLDGFGFTGLRIDKALRVFLLAICMPKQQSASDYLLDAFASRWYEANSRIVAYDRDVAAKMVRAVAQLNEALHGAIAQTPGVTGYPKRNIMSQDFIGAFKRLDARSLVSEDLLEKIYTSIRRERLSQARNSSLQNSVPEVHVTIKRPMPPRLTYRVQSEPVVLRIPHPDPQFAIQLYGQDLIFDPPALTFTKSAEASFRVTGTSLGPKSIIMWRSGPNALAYAGLPQSSSVVVERSFMRNTFQLAFANHDGDKRKYMFSVDDPLIRHQWVVSIKRQIDIAATTATATLRSVEASGQSVRTHTASEALAFRVLQETLISPDDGPTAIDDALAHLNGSSSYGNFPQDGGVFSSNGAYRRSRSNGSHLHARSKSRSQIYHKHGPGKLEPEEDSNPPSGDDGRNSALQQLPGERVWNGRDIEVVCQQNSAIPSVLKYLLGTSVDQADAAAS